jgi:hypothetical protein
MASMAIDSKIVKVCGHTEVDTIRYHSVRERELEQKTSRRSMCRSCAQKVEQWMSLPGQEKLGFELSPIVGTDRQIPWATEVRGKKVAAIAHILIEVSEQATLGDPAALGLYRALLAYIGVVKAKYWIDSRDEVLNHWHFRHEAEKCMRKDELTDRHGDFSAYGHLRLNDPNLLARIKLAQPGLQLRAS